MWFVDLAAIADDPAIVGRVRGRARAHGRTTGLRWRIRSWRTSRRATGCLVVDNCEHVIEDVAELLDELLERCPQLRVLATSRESLEIDGEHTWKVPSLGDRRGLGRRGAVRESRDCRGCGRSTRDPATLAIVGDIVERLDGIPLAIELAAAGREASTSPSYAIVSTIGSGSSRVASVDRASGRRRSKARCNGRTTS